MDEADPFRKYVEAGIAFTQLTKAKAEAVVRELVKAGDLQREHAQDRVDDLLDRSRKSTDGLVGVVRREIAAQLSSLGLATKEDVDKLAAKMDDHLNATPASAPPPVAKKATPTAAPTGAAESARTTAARKPPVPGAPTAAAKTAAGKSTPPGATGAAKSAAGKSPAPGATGDPGAAKPAAGKSPAPGAATATAKAVARPTEAVPTPPPGTTAGTATATSKAPRRRPDAPAKKA